MKIQAKIVHKINGSIVKIKFPFLIWILMKLIVERNKPCKIGVFGFGRFSYLRECIMGATLQGSRMLEKSVREAPHFLKTTNG